MPPLRWLLVVTDRLDDAELAALGEECRAAAWASRGRIRSEAAIRAIGCRTIEIWGSFGLLAISSIVGGWWLTLRTPVNEIRLGRLRARSLDAYLRMSGSGCAATSTIQSEALPSIAVAWRRRMYHLIYSRNRTPHLSSLVWLRPQTAKTRKGRENPCSGDCR